MLRELSHRLEIKNEEYPLLSLLVEIRTLRSAAFSQRSSDPDPLTSASASLEDHMAHYSVLLFFGTPIPSRKANLGNQSFLYA